MKLKFDYLAKCLMVLFVALGMSSLASAQRTVTGTIVDGETGDPLIGANILVVGTSIGTVTDIDGSFSIQVPKDATELEATYTGFGAQRVTLGSSNVVSITLTPGELLDEVVVIGYGTVKKDDATGAVAALGEEDFNKGFFTSPEQLIQGQVAGVQVTGSTGEPGAGNSIRIRGTGSIRGGNNALIVLDGVPLDGRDVSAGADIGAGAQSARNPLNFINPNDIESISVLKDASATAIYGSRGSNGVIIITTKKGKSGKPSLNFNASTNIGWMPEDRKYDLLDAGQFAQEVPSANQGGNVNAFDEITRTAITQDYNISYSGGNEQGSRYRVSLGYQDQEGIIENTGLNKLTGTFNISQKAWDDRLTIDARVLTSFVQDESAALSRNVGAEGDLLVSALRWNPTQEFFDGNGDFIQFGDNPRNPLAFLGYYDDNTETSRIFANLSTTFDILPNLSYKFNMGLDRSDSERRVALSKAFGANIAQNAQGIGNIENINASTKLFEHTLNFNQSLSSNIGFNALVGYSYQTFSRKGNNQRGTNFLIDDQGDYLSNLNYAGAFPTANNNSFFNPDDELQSVFGRVQLDVSNNLLVTATLRADGSSRFGEDNRYGYFPSAAIAYKLDDVVDAFDMLKIRAGWGITGNQEFPSGASQNVYKPTDNGDGQTLDTGGNPDLQWEETTQYNFGVDFAFLDYRISGSLDLYSRETNDLLFRIDAVQPAPQTKVWLNFTDASIVNQGVDLALNAILMDNGTSTWDLGINASIFKNEVRDITGLFPTGVQTGEINGQGLSGQRGQLLYDDQPLYAFYLPEFIGYDENGVAQYADLNGNGTDESSNIDAPGTGDRGFYGDPNPDFTLGIRTAYSWKNLDASMFWNGAFGHQVFDNTYLALFNRTALEAGGNVDAGVLTSGQSSADVPKPSTQFLQDADFMRLANLTVGYTIPVESTWLSNVRLYITGQNLVLFTGYTGFDPEVNVDKNVDDVPSFGIDYSTYPRARSVVFGANFNF